MKKINKRLIAMLILTGSLAGCSLFEDTDDDEAEFVAELPEIQAQFEPEVLWDQNVGDGVEDYFSQLKPVIDDGVLYSASRAGIVAAIDINSGKKNWQVDLSDIDKTRGFFQSTKSARIAGGPATGYGKVFLGSENGIVFALNVEDGALAWRSQVKGEVISTPAAENNILVVNSASGVLTALDIDTGNELWKVDQDVPPLTLRGISGVAITAGGVFIGSAAGEVGVYLLESGQQGWTQEIGERSGSTELERVVDVDVTPKVFGDKVYSISVKGNLAAMDLRSGRLIWKRQYSSYTDLTIDGNTIFVTDIKGHIYAIDRLNGLEKWSQLSLTNRGTTGPVAVGNYIVVGDNEGYLHWLSQDNGEFVARHQVDSSGLYAESVVNNRILYTQARNGEIQAIATP